MNRDVDLSSAAEPAVDARDYLAGLLRHRWLVLAVAAWSVGLAAFYTYTRTPLYTGRAEVLVKPVLTSPLDVRGSSAVVIENEAQIVDSTAVAEIAAGDLQGEASAERLLASLSVDVPENTQVMVLSFSDPDPARAATGAQAFAEAYLEFKTREALDAISRQTADLQEQMRTLLEDIRRQNERIATLPPDSPERRDAILERDTLEANLSILRTQALGLSSLSIDPGDIIQPATVPRSPSSPNHPLDLTLGGFLGLLLGMGAGIVRDRTDQRPRGDDDLERMLGAPTLAVVPRSRRLRQLPLCAVDDPRGVEAEVFRTLRTNVLVIAARRGTRSVTVTSAQAGEGKTTVAANVAAALAQVGRRVLAVSADLRHPRLHAVFDTPNDRGLGDVLAGACSLEDAVRPTRVPNLLVLPSGPPVQAVEALELLQSERMGQILGALDVDHVVVDAPPILTVADAIVLAGACDGVLLVADARQGRRRAILAARRLLERVDVGIIGGVLNRAARSSVSTAQYLPYDFRRGLLYRLLAGGSDRAASLERGSRREAAARRRG